MNYRIFRKNNYFILIDERGKFWEEHFVNVRVSKIDEPDTNYTIALIRTEGTPLNFDLKFNQIFDELGAPYASVAAWELWYSLNSGFESIIAAFSALGLATEATLASLLAAVQNGTEYEAKLVVDSASDTWLEVRVWNTAAGTFDPPVYYLAGSNVVGTPVTPVNYINPNTLLAQISANTTGINLEATQQLVLTELQSLNTVTGTLATEATLAALSLWITTNSATEVTLNSLLTAFNATDFATETTLSSIDTTASSVLTELLNQGLTLDDIETILGTLGTEVTLAQVLAELQAINIDTDGLSQEATQLLVLAALNNILSNTTGLATEVTLNALLTAFNAEDFATEATLDALNLWVQGNAATEVTLQAVLAELQGINLDTNGLNQETTQLLVLAALNTVISNTTGLSTEVTLNALLTAFNAEDFATETTLASLNAWLQANVATETTLSSVLTELQAINTDTDALANLSTEATQLIVLATLNNIFSTAGTLATEATLALIQAVTAQMTFTAGDLNVSANIQVGGSDVSVSNPVPVSGTITTSLEGFVDPGNSSITPLAAGATYTGTAIEITDYSAINVAAFSDVNSAINGLRMEFSPDGINWDHLHDFDVIGNIGVSYAQAAELRYFRIVYINGSSNQTVFRLTTILKATTVSPSRYTVEQTLRGGQMADVVKSVIFGKTTAGGGAYVDVKVTPSGSLLVENESIRVPNVVRSTGAGSIAVKAYDFSIANVGTANGVILGQTIKPGETLNFSAGSLSNYYVAGTITYNGTGTELVIIYNS
jgi:hypothetical protein